MWNFDLKVFKNHNFLPLSTPFPTLVSIQQPKGTGQYETVAC